MCALISIENETIIAEDFPIPCVNPINLDIPLSAKSASVIIKMLDEQYINADYNAYTKYKNGEFCFDVIENELNFDNSDEPNENDKCKGSLTLAETLDRTFIEVNPNGGSIHCSVKICKRLIIYIMCAIIICVILIKVFS